MGAEAILELLRQQPFVPFEIRLTNGDVHQIRHPEQALVLKSNIIIGFPGTDRFAICSLLHIASVHTIQAAA